MRNPFRPFFRVLVGVGVVGALLFGYSSYREVVETPVMVVDGNGVWQLAPESRVGGPERLERFRKIADEVGEVVGPVWSWVVEELEGREGEIEVKVECWKGRLKVERIVYSHLPDRLKWEVVDGIEKGECSNRFSLYLKLISRRF
jgi:hypothetical protein